MAIGDIMPFVSTGSIKTTGSMKYAVSSGTTGSIKPGEPVQKLAGTARVTAFLNNSPTATNRIVGVSASTSTETASAVGTVDVLPATNGQIFLISPKVAATWDTQTKYNNLVGARVLIDLASSTYTILAADGAGNGCVVEWLDIATNPGKVAFSFSPLVDYRNV